jgi:cell division protein FtsB
VSPRLLGSGAVVVLTLGLAAYGGNQVLRVTEMRREVDTMQRDLGTLRERAEELSRAVERLRNDPAAVEKLAREELGYVRPDETILKFPSTRRSPPARR